MPVLISNNPIRHAVANAVGKDAVPLLKQHAEKLAKNKGLFFGEWQGNTLYTWANERRDEPGGLYWIENVTEL